MLLGGGDRTPLQNSRLAAFLSKDLLEGVPLDRRVQVAGMVNGVLLQPGQMLDDYVNRDCACELVAGMVRVGTKGGVEGSSTSAGLERFLGEDDVRIRGGGQEDVGFKSKGWHDEYVAASSVLRALKWGGRDGFEEGLTRNASACALEGVFCILSSNPRTASSHRQGLLLDVPSSVRMSGNLFGDVKWNVFAPHDLSHLFATTRCIFAVVEPSQCASALNRGSHRVLQADKVRAALAEPRESRRSDSLLSIAKAVWVSLFQQLTREMMMDLTG